jgi:demethylmenaquinone methyltransferase/2-methoxy-6-polyprenyl-1,4-benzoquinol methylase
MSGLGADWRRVEEALAEISGSYDRINRFVSLGFDLRLRERALSLAGGDVNGRVLDAGSGPGTFSHLALRRWLRVDVIAMEPLDVMASLSKRRIESERFDVVRGVFEHMPFRSGTFDLVLTGFSIRDAIDLRAALSEIWRVIRQNGRYVVCDIAKPDRPPFRFIVSAYWFLISPVLGFLAAGRRGLRVWDIYRTYRRWPVKRKLIGMLDEFFAVERSEVAMLGGALIASFRR